MIINQFNWRTAQRNCEFTIDHNSHIIFNSLYFSQKSIYFFHNYCVHVDKGIECTSWFTTEHMKPIHNHRYTATVIDYPRQNEQVLTQEIMEICWENKAMQIHKITSYWEKYINFILWQRQWMFVLKKIPYKRPCHGVLRQVGAVTENPALMWLLVVH